jgi:Protein of unknown function (DUF3768)
MPDRNHPPESDATICAECGEDLLHHRCAAVIREQNDAFRADLPLVGVRLAKQELVITRGVAGRGNAFVDRALEAVRKYRNFTAENDPWGEHDFGKFELDDAELFWKIDYYDDELEMGSPDPADPALTRRVLTIMLAEEY